MLVQIFTIKIVNNTTTGLYFDTSQSFEQKQIDGTEILVWRNFLDIVMPSFSHFFNI